MSTVRHVFVLSVTTLRHWVRDKHGVGTDVRRSRRFRSTRTLQRWRIHRRANAERRRIQTLHYVTRCVLVTIDLRVIYVRAVGVVRAQRQLLSAHTAFETSVVEDHLIYWPHFLHLIHTVLTALAKVRLGRFEKITQTLRRTRIHRAVQRAV